MFTQGKGRIEKGERDANREVVIHSEEQIIIDFSFFPGDMAPIY